MGLQNIRIGIAKYRSSSSVPSKTSSLGLALFMIEVDTSELQGAVDGMHHCKARLVQSVPIREQFERKTQGR
jgi:hypothetical protein